ncbi:RHS repeat-associated core domain-containing protein [Paenarthrobacter sp. PAE-2]|uniref:RHS repeat-associated core domain-containing protein n=1 Tax=Paenarthrobacter sp. PAE-2 TaxID=2982532 RepID=UPI0039B6F713
MSQPTAGTGPITAIQRYTDPFGLARANNLTGTANNTYTAAGATTAGAGSNAANPAGFAAVNGYIDGLDDTISSLTHLGARDLDPVTGAFTTPDPILHTDQSEGFTPYSYSWGDPMNRADPSGLDPGASLIWAGAAWVAAAVLAIASTIKWPTFTMPTIQWPWEHSSVSSASSAPAAAPAAVGSFDYSNYRSVGGVTVSRPAIQPVAGGIGGGYVASSLGGTRFTTPAVRQGGTTFTSPAVRQGGQSTGDTSGANTGAALAAQNAVMHAASVAATEAIGHTNQAIMSTGTPTLPAALAGGPADTDVYFSQDASGNNVYAGITKDLTKRQSQHGDRFFIRGITKARVTRGEARAIEQALISGNPSFLNKINSISPKRPFFEQARDCLNNGVWGLA